MSDGSAGPLKNADEEVIVTGLSESDFAEAVWAKENEFVCVLKESPKLESRMSKAGVRKGWRVVAIGEGRDITMLPYPAVLRMLLQTPTKVRFRKPSKASQRETKLRGDDDSKDLDILKTAIGLNGGAARDHLKKYEIEVFFLEGSIGMTLEEKDAKWCAVKSVTPGGQGDKLGMLEGDCIVHTGDTSVPKNSTAIEVVLEQLGSAPRPLRCIVYRDPNNDAAAVEGTVDLDDLDYTEAENAVDDEEGQNAEASEDSGKGEYDDEIEFILQQGALGMTLHEVDNLHCEVNTVKPGGQASKLGIQAGDRIVEIHDEEIPESATAFDTAMSYLRSDQRPIRILVFRDSDYEVDHNGRTPEQVAEQGLRSVDDALKGDATSPAAGGDNDEYVKITIGPGSLGMELEEIDEEACGVKSISPDGQGAKLGFHVGDEFVSIGDHDIPNDDTAYSIVMTYLQTLPRPVVIVMYRDPHFEPEAGTHHHDQNHQTTFDIEFELAAGPLGLELEEIDGKFCGVKSVNPGGQGAALGFKVGDEFMSVGGHKIPEDNTAFNVAAGHLMALPRPVKVVVFRDQAWDPDAHTHSDRKHDDERKPQRPAEDDGLEEEAELEFTIEAGPLGMELEEIDGEACGVKSVRPDGQGAKLGFKVGDEFVSVGEHQIPEDDTAFTIVMSYLKTLPRPLMVKMFRDNEYEPEAHAHGDAPAANLDAAAHAKHMPSQGNEFEIEFTIEAGPLGMELEEIDGEACGIKNIHPGGQGERLGFKVGDEFVSIGEVKIPEDDTAFAVVIDNLKKQPRPLKTKMFRDTKWDGDKHEHGENSVESKKKEEDAAKPGLAKPDLPDLKPGPELESEQESTPEPSATEKKEGAEEGKKNEERKTPDAPDIEKTTREAAPEPKPEPSATEKKEGAEEGKRNEEWKTPDAPEIEKTTREAASEPKLETKENELGPNHRRVSLPVGSLGMALMGLDGRYCVIKRISDGGAAQELGLHVNDRVVSIGEQVVAHDDHAFSTTMTLLKSLPRPVDAVLYRPPKKETHELRFIMTERDLGMSFELQDSMRCVVKDVTKGGHAEVLQIQPGDEVHSLNGNKVPHDAVALKFVTLAVEKMKRPLKVVVKRNGTAQTKKKRGIGVMGEAAPEEKSDTLALPSTDKFAKVVSSTTYQLPPKPKPDEYVVQWKDAKSYRKKGLELSAILTGNGAEVAKVGKKNEKLGIHALDILVGIQRTDVKDLPFSTVEILLKAALAKLKKKTPLVLRLAHHDAKFKDVGKSPGPGESDLTFHDAPCGKKGGMTLAKHGSDLCVAEVKPKSFAAGHHVVPGYVIVAIDGKDMSSFTPNIVMHIIQFADTPVTVRFRTVDKKPLAKELLPGEREFVISTKMISRKHLAFKFDMDSDGVEVESFDGKYVAAGHPAVEQGDPLVGIEEMDVRDDMDAYIYHLLMMHCKNKRKKSIKLRIGKKK
jgi:C-terminal processing protease CtpA/Prc